MGVVLNGADLGISSKYYYYSDQPCLIIDAYI